LPDGNAVLLISTTDATIQISKHLSENKIKSPGAEAPGLESDNQSYWSAWGGVSVLNEQVGFVPTLPQT
jgi:hypothetical protein